ncbi:hypothetical protein F0U60_54495 [Archangium minus]|uniref:Uncharacterized protein n=1 Tax=Archangium minus TaxID=83450 RepID=A0ABY9X9T1_9BACT|nr:hypothetical protein F0U60_54495 [Archangium minus]
MEVVWVAVLGMLVFSGLFILMCPEWWSTSLGTLKEKKRPDAEERPGVQVGKPESSHRAFEDRRPASAE